MKHRNKKKLYRLIFSIISAAPIEIAVEEVVESDSVDYEPEITTYSPPIDFKLGTTASGKDTTKLKNIITV